VNRNIFTHLESGVMGRVCQSQLLVYLPTEGTRDLLNLNLTPLNMRLTELFDVKSLSLNDLLCSFQALLTLTYLIKK